MFISDEKSSKTSYGETKFLINGLQILGCSLEEDKLVFSNEFSSELPNIGIEWVLKEEDKEESQYINLPIYLDLSRKDIIFNMDFKVSLENKQLFYQHGVAVLANSYI